MRNDDALEKRCVVFTAGTWNSGYTMQCYQTSTSILHSLEISATSGPENFEESVAVHNCVLLVVLAVDK